MKRAKKISTAIITFMFIVSVSWSVQSVQLFAETETMLGEDGKLWYWNGDNWALVIESAGEENKVVSGGGELSQAQEVIHLGWQPDTFEEKLQCGYKGDGKVNFTFTGTGHPVILNEVQGNEWLDAVRGGIENGLLLQTFNIIQEGSSQYEQVYGSSENTTITMWLEEDLGNMLSGGLQSGGIELGMISLTPEGECRLYPDLDDDDKSITFETDFFGAYGLYLHSDNEETYINTVIMFLEEYEQMYGSIPEGAAGNIWNGIFIISDDEVVTYYPNGNKMYEGSFSAGQYDGSGIWYSDDGKELYQGQFAGGIREGEGKLYQENILVYDGEWKEDVYEGKGKLYDSESGKLLYIGDFIAGQYHGEGKSYDRNTGKIKDSGIFLGGFYDGGYIQ